MSIDISKYVDVSTERRSSVCKHMLLDKEKGESLCKLCHDKKVTKTVYAKNGRGPCTNYVYKRRGVSGQKD